ncbi:hypothetical protein MMC07_006914 [Pseudocyphellaria aurata]|nr:hypothetical protein [Pseudocyphellaria aurata]
MAAANRQERELMRQRGAGTRQIKDLDFQLVLPGQPTVPKEPLSPQKSGRSRRTPQIRKVLGTRSSTRKPTPSRKKAAGKLPSSNLPISEDQASLPTRSDRDEQATKKRRLGLKRNEEVMESNGLAQNADERPATIHEEKAELPQADETASQSVILQARGKKRKKRKCIGQNSMKKPRLQNAGRDRKALIAPPEETPRPLNDQQKASIDSQNENIKTKAQSTVEIAVSAPERSPQDSAREIDAEVQNLTVSSSKSPAQPRKKRKPIGQQQPRRKATQVATVGDSVQDLDSQEVQNETVNSSKSPAVPRPRKKRKSIGQQQPRRRATAAATAGVAVPALRTQAAEAASEDQAGVPIVKKSRVGRSKKTLSSLDAGSVQDENLQGTNSHDVSRNTIAAGTRRRPKKIPSSADVEVHDEVLTDKNDPNHTQNLRSARGRGKPRKISSSLDGDVQDEFTPNIDIGDGTENPHATRGKDRPRKVVSVDAPIQGENDEDGGDGDSRPVEKMSTRKRGRPKLNVLSKASEASSTVKQKTVRNRDARDPDALDGEIQSGSGKAPKDLIPNSDLDFEKDHLDSINPSAFPKNSSVNAVDALAQICREMVCKCNNSLGEAAKNERNKARKTTLERDRKNIETYGEEFNNRLLQLTEILDTNLALLARVRQADKDEKTLGPELKSLQEDGEAMAKQTSQIEEAKSKPQARANLAALIRDIEGAVRHGRDMDNVPHAEGPPETAANEVVQTPGGIDHPGSSLQRDGEDANSAPQAEGAEDSGVKSITTLPENPSRVAAD